MVDYYGKCSLCGIQCYDREGNVFTKNIVVNYKLSDNSVAGILFCNDCQKKPKEAPEKAIIEQSLRDGWEHELSLVNWDEETKQVYRNKYYNLTVIEKE